jgi:hypothetical protein
LKVTHLPSEKVEVSRAGQALQYTAIATRTDCVLVNICALRTFSVFTFRSVLPPEKPFILYPTEQNLVFGAGNGDGIWVLHLYAHLLTCLLTFLPTYVFTFTFLLTYVHTFVLTYLRTYVLTYLFTYLCAYLRTYLRAYLRNYLRTSLGAYLLTYLLT